MKHCLISIALTAGLLAPAHCWAAELGAGDALSPQSAVKVLSAESDDDLFQTVTSWVESRHPEVRVTRRSFEYIADDRAHLILLTWSNDGMRSFYFETPGLPFQFVRPKK